MGGTPDLQIGRLLNFGVGSGAKAWIIASAKNIMDFIMEDILVDRR